MENGNFKRTGVLIQGFDIFDIVGYLHRTNKKYQATLLSNVEGVIDRDSQEYETVRKMILDSTNNYVRAIVTAIFGDINV